MRRCVIFAILLLSSWTLSAVVMEPPPEIFFDDFDSAAPGTLPPEWDIVWSGAGPDLQGVSDARSSSNPFSFELLGRRGWSAVVQRAFDSDSPTLGYEFKIFIENAARRGEEHPAFFSYQAEGNLWGTYYASVRFNHRRGAILAEDGTFLASWQPQTWYAVRVVLDRDAKTYSVWIDGQKVGEDLALAAESPELIDSLALVSGHAGVPVYYDDVAVFVPEPDLDGDGIPDLIDPCPDLNPGLIDINVDGCVDTNLVIATFIQDEVTPIEPELPDAAMDCVDGAVLNLQLEAVEISIEDMLCAAETLAPIATEPAAHAGNVVGLAAQTTALLAIDQATLLVGPDDPNIIAANTLAGIGMELLENLKIPEAVKAFLDAVSQLFDPPKPSILVEVNRRNSMPFIWESYTTTFGEVFESVWYLIRVTNTGNVDLADIAVTQTISNYETVIPGLAVGESIVVNQDRNPNLWIRSRYGDPFEIVSYAACLYEGKLVEDAAIAEVDIIHPALDVEIDAPDSAKPGEKIQITVTVTNTGDVVVRDIWYLAWPPIQQSDLAVGDMAPGASTSYHYEYVVPENGRRTIRLRARAMGGRDYDNGFDWQLRGRRVDDSDSHRIRITR